MYSFFVGFRNTSTSGSLGFDIASLLLLSSLLGSMHSCWFIMSLTALSAISSNASAAAAVGVEVLLVEVSVVVEVVVMVVVVLVVVVVVLVVMVVVEVVSVGQSPDPQEFTAG